MSRTIPRFDTLAAAKYDSTPNDEKRHRTDLEEVFGENVFGLHQMKARMPSAQYEALLSTVQNGTELDASVAPGISSFATRAALRLSPFDLSRSQPTLRSCATLALPRCSIWAHALHLLSIGVVSRTRPISPQ